MTTTLNTVPPTLTQGGRERVESFSHELVERYHSIIDTRRLSWTQHQHLTRLLGKGGQGSVYLSERRGIDGFTLPIAVKIFSPERYPEPRDYEQAMGRIARVAARVAQIQQDNLLDVHDFFDRNRIRMMGMEWVDGYDLARLLASDVLERVRNRVSAFRWRHLNEVVVTQGPSQPRMKPGVAIAIVRDCLAALAALHREGIVHGDIKPSNIMVKRTGNVKIVDIGSAFEISDPPVPRSCTPTYAAPEILEHDQCTELSDLASLGYVLIELLSGRRPFSGKSNFRELLEEKRFLAQRLPQILPDEVTCNELLMNFCRRLIAPDPTRRFPSAEAADLVQEGAAAFHRQLVISNLASEYGNEIRLWLYEVKELESLHDREIDTH